MLFAGAGGRIRQTLCPSFPAKFLYGPRREFCFALAHFQVRLVGHVQDMFNKFGPFNKFALQADLASGNDAMLLKSSKITSRGRGRYVTGCRCISRKPNRKCLSCRGRASGGRSRGGRVSANTKVDTTVPSTKSIFAQGYAITDSGSEHSALREHWPIDRSTAFADSDEHNVFPGD